jgi:hypothetical protein
MYVPPLLEQKAEPLLLHAFHTLKSSLYIDLQVSSKLKEKHLLLLDL